MLLTRAEREHGQQEVIEAVAADLGFAVEGGVASGQDAGRRVSIARREYTPYQDRGKRGRLYFEIRLSGVSGLPQTEFTVSSNSLFAVLTSPVAGVEDLLVGESDLDARFVFLAVSDSILRRLFDRPALDALRTVGGEINVGYDSKGYIVARNFGWDEQWTARGGVEVMHALLRFMHVMAARVEAVTKDLREGDASRKLGTASPACTAAEAEAILSKLGHRAWRPLVLRRDSRPVTSLRPGTLLYLLRIVPPFAMVALTALVVGYMALGPLGLIGVAAALLLIAYPIARLMFGPSGDVVVRFDGRGVRLGRRGTAWEAIRNVRIELSPMRLAMPIDDVPHQNAELQLTLARENGDLTALQSDCPVYLPHLARLVYFFWKNPEERRRLRRRRR